MFFNIIQDNDIQKKKLFFQKITVEACDSRLNNMLLKQIDDFLEKTVECLTAGIGNKCSGYGLDMAVPYAKIGSKGIKALGEICDGAWCIAIDADILAFMNVVSWKTVLEMKKRREAFLNLPDMEMCAVLGLALQARNGAAARHMLGEIERRVEAPAISLLGMKHLLETGAILVVAVKNGFVWAWLSWKGGEPEEMDRMLGVAGKDVLCMPVLRPAACSSPETVCRSIMAKLFGGRPKNVGELAARLLACEMEKEAAFLGGIAEERTGFDPEKQEFFAWVKTFGIPEKIFRARAKVGKNREDHVLEMGIEFGNMPRLNMKIKRSGDLGGIDPSCFENMRNMACGLVYGCMRGAKNEFMEEKYAV